jgi:hypothetical protein
MLTERITALIHADVDGELAEHDRAELSRELLQSQEARKFREDMIRIRELMASIPGLDLPAGLHSKMSNAIRLPRRRRFSKSSSRWFQSAGYGLSLAAGLLMGVGIAQVSTGVSTKNTQDLSAVVGTMLSRTGGQLGATGESLTVNLDYVQGNIKRSYLDRAIALEFDLKSVEPVEITIDLRGTGMSFGGLSDQDLSPAFEEFEVSDGKVHLRSSGNQQIVLFLRNGPEGTTDLQDIGISLAHHETNIHQGQSESG